MRVNRIDIPNKAEANFASTLRAQGIEYEHQPRGFRLYYRPDFYVPARNCYYEVVGTRQALSLNADKICAFLRTYPDILLKLVDAKGQLLQFPQKQSVLIHGLRAPRIKKGEKGFCGMCGSSFTKRHPWQQYDKAGCKMKAYWHRRVKREGAI